MLVTSSPPIKLSGKTTDFHEWKFLKSALLLTVSIALDINYAADWFANKLPVVLSRLIYLRAVL